MIIRKIKTPNDIKKKKSNGFLSTLSPDKWKEKLLPEPAVSSLSGFRKEEEEEEGKEGRKR